MSDAVEVCENILALHRTGNSHYFIISNVFVALMLFVNISILSSNLSGAAQCCLDPFSRGSRPLKASSSGSIPGDSWLMQDEMVCKFQF